MTRVHAYAAMQPGADLQPYEYELGPIAADEVELKVESCGICHSDLSMLDNQWNQTSYPFVPGHEVIGVVDELGSSVNHLKRGQRVGLGWYAGSCMTCGECMGGQHHLCAISEQTIVNRHGGFADRVRCRAAWAIALPDSIDPKNAGPLFCGGITVFNPIIQAGVLPTQRVGVIGIGGLGHLAIQFLNKWGCHVTAFSSTATKSTQIEELGAHQVIDTYDQAAINAIERSLDFLLVTVNVTLNWEAMLSTLAPNGRMHVVGAVLEPMAIPAFALIGSQRSVAGSPLGSPAMVASMLEFCGRHQIAPQAEYLPMSQVNDALTRLREGKPRFRLVLTRD